MRQEIVFSGGCNGRRIGSGPIRADPIGRKQGLVFQHLAEEALGRLQIALGRQEKVDRRAVLVDGPVHMAACNHRKFWLTLSGADAAMRVFLFCLVWSDSGSVWSVDAWSAARRNVAGPPTVVERSLFAPLRLIRFQVALIYLNAGMWKIFNPYWRNGSAVHYVVQSNIYRRLPHGMPLGFDHVVSLLTYGTLAWELSFAFLLLFARTRRIALVAGILIHLGMLLTIEVGPFHFIMLASYLAFLEPDAVPRLSRRLLTFLGRPPSVPARLETAANQ